MSSREYPAHAVAAVAAVVLSREHKLLVIKRAHPPGKELWALPGGVIEAGEGVLEAAKRELAEETGLEGEPDGILGVAQVIRHDANGMTKWHYVIVLVSFDPEKLRGELRPGGDAAEAAWFHLEELISRNDVSATTKSLAKLLREKALKLPLSCIIS